MGNDSSRDPVGIGVGDGQGSLACCSPWGLKESEKTEQLSWDSAAFS